MQYDVAKKTNTEKVLEIFSPLDTNEYLTQLVVGPEETPIESLNEKLKIGHRRQTELRNKLHNPDTNSVDKEKIRAELRKLSKGLQMAHIHYDISLLLDTAYSVARPLLGTIEEKGKLSYANMPMIDGKPNPHFMSIDELREANGALTTYRSMLEESFMYLQDVMQQDGVDQERIKSVRKRVSNALNQIINAQKLAENKIAERLTSGAKSADNIDLNRPIQKSTYFERMFNSLSEIDHPVFEYARSLIFEADNNKRQNVLEFSKELEPKLKELYTYADSIGVSHMDIFNKFIEDKGFQLKSMYKKDLYDVILPNIRSTGNVAKLKEMFTIKQNYLDKYSERLDNAKKRYDDIYADESVPGEEMDSFTTVDKSILRKTALEEWVAKNDPKLDSFWLNAKQQGNLSMKEEYREQYYSDDYKEISKTPALRDFYDFMIEKNQEFGRIVGRGVISVNFLPKVRKTLLDEAIQSDTNKLGKAWELFWDAHRIGQDGIMGQYDANTGELLPRVPLLFTNPFKDKEGNIDTTKNSRDLGRNLMLFAESAYNYQEKTRIEPIIMALEEWMSVQANKTGVNKPSSRYAPEKDPRGEIRKVFGKTDDLGTFKSLMSYYIYGQKLQNDKVVKMFGMDLSRNALLRSVMNYHRAKTLGFAIIPPIAARIAGEGSIYFEGVKGRYYSTKDMLSAHKMFVSNRPKSNMLVKFLNVYQEDQSYKLATGLSANKLSAIATLDNLYKGYSLADEKIDNTVAIAMSISHGINKDGNVYKLSEEDIKNGEKSIIDRMKVENDRVSINGMTERSYLQFRSKIRSVTGSIKGLMSAEDINAINTSLVGQMVMMYRNWMPRVVKERFGKFRYNPITKDFDQGRYSIMMNQTFNDQATLMTVLSDIGRTGLRMIGFMGNISAYKLQNPDSEYYKRSKKIIENEYNKFKEKYEGDVRFTDNFTIDDYIDLRIGQLRAFIAEARVIVLFLSIMLAGKADWDDDDAPEYKDIWITRKLFQVLNRSQSEWSFVWNPSEWKNFFSSPFALSGMFSDITNLFTNTFDVLKGDIVGTEDNRDRTPRFYYSSKWLPGGRNVFGFMELFKQDEQKTR
jgi:hypothetical protein